MGGWERNLKGIIQTEELYIAAQYLHFFPHLNFLELQFLVYNSFIILM